MNLFIGTSGYAYKEWKGSFYPKDLPAKEMLGYYAARFDAVEINNSFYKTPSLSALEGWATEVAASPDRDPKAPFLFALKAPQRITHFKRLKDAAEPLTEFIQVASALDARLGPLFFQLPPNMKKDAARLNDFLGLLPPKSDRRVAFEFRHPSWFDDEVFDLLRRRGVALCIADADDDLEVPFEATADWGYLRLRRAEYSKADLKKWLDRIRSRSWRDAFIFFKHEDEAKGPRFAQALMELAGGTTKPASPRRASAAKKKPPKPKPRSASKGVTKTGSGSKSQGKGENGSVSGDARRNTSRYRDGSSSKKPVKRRRTS